MTAAHHGRRRLWSALTLLLVFGALYWVFRGALPDIRDDLSRFDPGGAALLLAAGFLYEAGDAAVCLTLLRRKQPDIPFSAAWKATFLGVFANVATLAAGTLPMQSCYLYHCGIDAGSSLGIMGSVYVLHKCAVLLYATAALLLGGRWLRAAGGSGLARYIAIGYGVSACIILFLTLLYTWEPVLRLIRFLLGKLPDTAVWRDRRQRWLAALTTLQSEARKVLLLPANLVRGLALELVKLFMLYSIPWLSLRLLGVKTLRFHQAQLLTSLLLLITSALPNIAGIGPTEFAFLLIFSGFMDGVTAASALTLYRIATYFAPFLYSALVFLHLRRKIALPSHNIQERN